MRGEVLSESARVGHLDREALQQPADPQTEILEVKRFEEKIVDLRYQQSVVVGWALREIEEEGNMKVVPMGGPNGLDQPREVRVGGAEEEQLGTLVALHQADAVKPIENGAAVAVRLEALDDHADLLGVKRAVQPADLDGITRHEPGPRANFSARVAP
jgi:hypothetical protein